MEKKNLKHDLDYYLYHEVFKKIYDINQYIINTMKRFAFRIFINIEMILSSLKIAHFFKIV